jgi:hypothetical protein
MHEYTWFILGNGRMGYLERTIASWEANLLDRPKYKIIFDDSGSQEYVKYLNQKYADRFTVVPIADKRMGQVYSIQFIFNYLKTLDTDFILEVEEDWMLFRPIQITQIMKILENNKYLLQMRIPRTVWYADYDNKDILHGSILNYLIKESNMENSFISSDLGCWYEWRGTHYFWSHNPCVFHRRILNYTYDGPSGYHHEQGFGLKLLKENKDYRVGSFSSNLYDAYVSHIGIHNNEFIKAVNRQSLN